MLIRQNPTPNISVVFFSSYLAYMCFNIHIKVCKIKMEYLGAWKWLILDKQELYQFAFHRYVLIVE